MLIDICRDDVLTAKYLIAPSLRVGFQWLDTVTRSGQPVLNVHVKTLRRMALDLASHEMAKKGLTFLRGAREEVLINRIFDALRKKGEGYLSGLNPSPGLVRCLRGTIRDIRLAGLASSKFQSKAFEVASKGREMKILLDEYERALKQEKLADYADVLRMAARHLKDDQGILSNAVVILPEDIRKDLSGLERDLWNAVPEKNRIILPLVSENADVEIFRAVGEVNEVREILRRCVREGIPFDEVEILHTDRDVYVPLIYEVVSGLGCGADGAVPATFDEGIPTRFSRPGRALLGWLSWIRDGFPQSTSVRMIQDGLLEIPGRKEMGLGFTRLGVMFRSVSVGAGRDRYLRFLNEEIAGIEKQKGRKSERLDGLRILRNLIKQILADLPAEGSSQKTVLQTSATFIEGRVRCAGRVDEYGREILLKRIKELAGCLDPANPPSPPFTKGGKGGFSSVEGLDVYQWLADLPSEARILGQGPRPGCIYVSSIRAGGHSGRAHTFIVGLDDGRFPGAGLQDPLLLDRERGRISKELPTASVAAAKAAGDFANLLARLRGNVTLSYCCRDLRDDREMFPSPAILDACGKVTGDPVSFAPADAGSCIDSTEWWLWRMCGSDPVKDPEKVIADHFPHLGRGMAARDERRSDRFTIYDGYVPEAGRDLDPRRQDGPVLSASRLEMLGKCPMEYFLKYVLGIEPPEEYEIDPSLWLDPLEKGSLLHAVFHQFMAALIKEGRLPEFPGDEKELYRILDGHIERERNQSPPPNNHIFERDCRELRQTARIFLQEETEFCKGSRPMYLEVAIGLRPEGGGTVLDGPRPVFITLADGRALRARGRIDRVDEISNGKNRYSVWDYKTGGSYGFDEKDPFRGGRRVQSVMYLAMTEARLKEKVSPDAVVERFGYFFPNVREHGNRISWPASDLADGSRVLARLCDMLAGGCFSFSDDPNDVRYSDYTAAFGDTAAAAEAVQLKMKNTDNKMLEPLCRLRGC